MRGEDWQILKEVCGDDPMFFELQSSLLDVEREFRGMSRRARIYEALEDRFIRTIRVIRSQKTATGKTSESEMHRTILPEF